MKHVLTTIFLSIGIVAFVQAQTMPSPAPSGNVKNANSSVGLFTGTANIGLPLYTATAKNGASVPVAINYSATGIRVDEISGPVGLGWQLIAGGSITRVTRGVPDERAEVVGDPATVTHSKLSSILNGGLDSEKDLFYFNFPGGSGKFIFDDGFHSWTDAVIYCNSPYASSAECVTACGGNSACEMACADQQHYQTRLECEIALEWTNFHTMPYSDLDITYGFTGFTDGYWHITDPQGVVYKFETAEITTSNHTEPNGSTFVDTVSYISTWHLTSIEYPNTNDVISFAYEDSINQTTVTSEYRTFASGATTGGNLTVDSVQETKYQTIIGVRYLDKIQFSKGSIDFTYQDRDDLTGGKRLSQVDLKDKAENVVSTTILNQEYFSAQRSYKQGTQAFCAGEGEVCKRLKLESVHRDGALVQAYTYRNEEESPSGINYYELPPRNSLYFDHWGYWNAGGTAGNNYEKYPKLLNAQVEERPGVNYQLSGGTDRSTVVQDYVTANMLTRVSHATGGYTLYEYEKHTSSGGGARVKSIKTFDEDGSLIAGSTYAYSLPSVAPIPVYHMMYALGVDQLIIEQRSKTNVMALNGPSIGYDKVTVTDVLGQGKVEHYFHDDFRTNDTAPVKSSYFVGDSGGLTSHGTISNPLIVLPFSTYSLLYYDRGSYDKIESYDAANTLVSRKSYAYDPINIADDFSVTNLALQVKKDLSNGKDVYLSRYDIKVRTYRLASVTDEFYDTGGNVSTTTTYTYHNGHKTLPDTVTSVKSDGYKSRTITSYLGAYGGKNTIGVPEQVEQQIRLPQYGTDEFKTSGVSKTEFTTVNGSVVPSKVKSLPLDAPLTAGTWSTSNLITVNDMIEYYDDGMIKKQSGLDGIVTEYTYDADGYLTKTTVNGRSTDYTYNPLVGISQVKDANNRTVSYEYDDRNRLLLTRNDDNEITSRYRYVSQTDNLALNATIDVTYHADGNYAQRSHSFSLSNINCPYGECTYSWNWGDGSSSGNVTSASHTWSTHGSFDVEVTITNPEYASPQVITQSVTMQEYVEWDAILYSPSPACEGDSQARFWVNLTTGLSTCSPLTSYTYEWKYKITGGTWAVFSTTDEAFLPSAALNVAGTYQISVTVEDNCTREVTKTNLSYEVEDCGGGGGGGTCSLIVSNPGTYIFGPNGGTQGFSITSTPSGESWSVTSSPSWVTVNTPTGSTTGTSLNISVSSYSGADRSGNIVISGNGCSRTISITQDGTANPCGNPGTCEFDYNLGRCVIIGTTQDCGT